MARTATSSIFIQANPIGLTISTGTPITLYEGIYTEGNSISPLEVNETSLTVQNLVDGICIPSGVIASNINQIDVFIGGDCQTYETIYLEQLPTDTPTPTPTATPTPTPTSQAPVTPTPTPTSTAATTFYRTSAGTSGNDICCEPALTPIWFSMPPSVNGFPTFGSRAYIDANLIDVFNGSGLFYGIIDGSYNQQALKYVYISSDGYVGSNGDCPC